MALRITRSPAARRDLIEIWSYIADDNPFAADKLLWRLEDVFSMLSEAPLAGRARPELHPDIRSFSLGNYITFYRVVPDAVDIVRVLSRFRDVDESEFTQ